MFRFNEDTLKKSEAYKRWVVPALEEELMCKDIFEKSKTPFSTFIVVTKETPEHYNVYRFWVITEEIEGNLDLDGVQEDAVYEYLSTVIDDVLGYK
jgi:hypothetical protein